LETERFVAAASPNGRVRLGPALLRLAGAVRSDYVALIHPYLEQLSHDLSETVDLAIIQGDHLVFIDQVISSQRLRTVSAVGESFPLYCTANGKAYLATLSDDQIAALLGRAFEARTPFTLTQLDELIGDLKSVRGSGVAFDREEHAVGICAAGVAFYDPQGNPLANSVPVPAQRFEEQCEAIKAALLATRRALERQFENSGT
jgi:DNA-binding IclR family transcriptional regulator